MSPTTYTIFHLLIKEPWAGLFKTNDTVSKQFQIQMLISEICQCFMLKKCEQLLHQISSM